MSFPAKYRTSDYFYSAGDRKCRYLFSARNHQLSPSPLPPLPSTRHVASANFAHIALFPFLIPHWKSKRQFVEIVITRKCHLNLRINAPIFMAAAAVVFCRCCRSEYCGCALLRSLAFFPFFFFFSCKRRTFVFTNGPAP